MATITAFKRKKGTVYSAQIRIRHKGRIVHTENKTFSKRSMAKAWAKRRESELEQLQGDPKLQLAKVTVGDLIQRYIDDFGEQAGRTKRYHLKQLLTFDLSEKSVDKLTSEVLVEHIRERGKHVSPSTALNDLIWLRNVLKAADTAWSIPATTDEVDKAMVLCRQYKLVSKSRRRERRPTPDELEALSEFFQSRDGRASIPMYDIMWFAIHSTRRQAEITRLEWDDNDESHRTGLVRDLKHPRKKEGNHRRFKYTEAAWEIVQRQPRMSKFIFPYNSKSIGAAFTRACKMLEIEDLRFHDLRHESVSRLFESERRYTIPEVQLFSLQDDWNIMRRYTQLRPEDLD